MTKSWIDEWGSFDPTSQVLAQTTGAVSAALGRKVVDPLDIGCRSCGAQPHQRCSDTFRHKAHERKPHRRRKTDAQLVQEAARALTHPR